MIPLKEMRIGIIGTGNVAWHLCKLLHAEGLEVSGILVRNSARAKEKRLADLFAAPLIDEMELMKSSSDMIFIAVNDSSIRNVVLNLVDFKGVVVHTAGSVALEVIASVCADAGVFYPLQTLTRGKEVPATEIPFCIEASNPETGNLLLELASELGCPAVRMDSEQRLLLHVAAVIACNFSNHLNVLARIVAKEVHADFSLLLPLIRETNRKIQGIDPLDAQTGPAVRGDFQTIEKHLKALENLPEIQHVYRVLSNSVIHHHQNKLK